MKNMYSKITLGLLVSLCANNIHAMKKNEMTHETGLNRVLQTHVQPASTARIPISTGELLRRSIPTNSPSSPLTEQLQKPLSTLSLLDPANNTTPQSRKPQSLTSVPNWTETFTCKNGLMVTRTPQNISYINGGLSLTAGKGINLSNSNINGRRVNLHLDIDMTRDQFVAALKKDGNL